MQHRKLSFKGRTPKEFVDAIAQHRFWEREKHLLIKNDHNKRNRMPEQMQ
jgi:hypothetical protein